MLCSITSDSLETINSFVPMSFSHICLAKYQAWMNQTINLLHLSSLLIGKFPHEQVGPTEGLMGSTGFSVLPGFDSLLPPGIGPESSFLWDFFYASEEEIEVFFTHEFAYFFFKLPFNIGNPNIDVERPRVNLGQFSNVVGGPWSGNWSWNSSGRGHDGAWRSFWFMTGSQVVTHLEVGWGSCQASVKCLDTGKSFSLGSGPGGPHQKLS